MNFQQDIRDYIEKEFESLNIDYLPSNDLEDDLLKLLTLHKKYIFKIPRKVLISKELQKKIDNGFKYKKQILQLKFDLEKGEDVNPHQSKNLLNYHVHDDLVYDWKIYHFHLSLEKESSNYFTKRTKELLFVYITDKQALLLDALIHPPHDNFANKILLEIIDNNWKNVLLELNGVVGIANNINQQQRFTLRKHNINTGIVEVNGKFIASPGLGKSASGHSTENVLKLNRLLSWLEENQDIINKNKNEIDKIFMKLHNLSTPPFYKIVFNEQVPQIWDNISKTCLVKYNEVINLK